MSKKAARTTADTELKGTESRFAGNDDRATEKIDNGLIYGKKQYKIMGIGIGLIVIGFFLMSGGSMPSSEVWDESIIYSPRRTVLAPLFILAGFGLQVYAIFTRK